MSKIDNNAVKALLAEVGSLKLVLTVLTKAVLPADAKQANEEIDALIKNVQELAFRSAVGGLERQSSDLVMRVSSQEAVRFLNGLRPKSQGH